MSSARRLRSARKTAERLLVLCAACAVAGDGALRKSIRPWLKKQGLWSAASPAEKSFLEAGRSTRKDRINFSWQAEAVHVLGWALGLVPQLAAPSAQASTRDILGQVPAPGASTAAFLRKARLRPAEEIDAAAEGLYQAHWSCRDADLNGRPEPNGYDIEVVQERHRAVNWLIRYGNADWDDVATDT